MMALRQPNKIPEKWTRVGDLASAIKRLNMATMAAVAPTPNAIQQMFRTSNQPKEPVLQITALQPVVSTEGGVTKRIK